MHTEDGQLRALCAAVVSREVLTRMGKRYGLTAAVMRQLAGIAVLSAGGLQPTYAGIKQVLSVTDWAGVRRAMNQLLAAGFVSQQRVGRQLGSTKMSFRLEPAGAVVMEEVQRELRRTIEQAGQIKRARPLRKYVRKKPKD